MLPTSTNRLAAEQRQQLHPDFLANEAAYLRMREGLLGEFRGQWVAVHQGQVVASGASVLAVMDMVGTVAGHPYVALVGHEGEVVFRARRSTFAYDAAYQPFSIPRLTATFWNHALSRSQTFSDVVPDTGSDATVLPRADCIAIDLFNSPYLTGMSGGVVGPGTTTLFYHAKVELDGMQVSALVQPLTGGAERILGRDVLNQHRVLFDGPALQVIVNP
jgi:hypothetical protein